MSQRKKVLIKRSVMEDFVLYMKSLPKRELDPDFSFGLRDIFRTKEYAVEIKNALKNGYTFDHIAEILSVRFGVAISGRQLQYHYTRSKNHGMKKNESVMKPKRVKIPKDTREATEGSAKVIDTGAKSSQTFPGIDSRISKANRTKSDVLPGDKETE